MKLRVNLSLFCGVVAMLITNMAGAQATNTFPSSGNVGIGTTSPSYPLQVEQSGVSAAMDVTPATWAPGSTAAYTLGVGTDGLYANWGSGVSLQTHGGDIFFNIGSTDNPPVEGANTRLILANGGNVGIGTTDPVGSLDVLAPGGKDILLGGGSSTGSEIKFLYPGVAHFSIYNNGNGNLTIANTGAQSEPNGPSAPLVSIAAGGNVGFGTTSPAYNLDVVGKIHTSTAMIFGDGSQQTTAWTGVLCGGDYAEAMNAEGGKTRYEPGDVLVLSSGGGSDIQKSAAPYSTLVAGIYATKPGVVGRRVELAKSTDQVPMAMVGVVPTKVTAENGPIHRGDLLVTSPTPGYAMKGTDRSRMLGAVVGKAMGTLASGKGVIEVLVTLQ